LTNEGAYKLSANVKKISITKISKTGMSKTVGSAFGFGSWTVGGTSIEIEIDPPIDISTDGGQESYKKLKDTLSKMVLKALNEDIVLACSQDKELNASMAKRTLLVNNAIEHEQD
jgi:hypothetical protein